MVVVGEPGHRVPCGCSRRLVELQQPRRAIALTLNPRDREADRVRHDRLQRLVGLGARRLTKDLAPGVVVETCPLDESSIARVDRNGSELIRRRLRDAGELEAGAVDGESVAKPGDAAPYRVLPFQGLLAQLKGAIEDAAVGCAEVGMRAFGEEVGETCSGSREEGGGQKRGGQEGIWFNEVGTSSLIGQKGCTTRAWLNVQCDHVSD